MCSLHKSDEMIHPFDALALDYDNEFTQRLLGRWLREKVWARLANCFSPGEHVLELGCGTGDDAVWLAQRGIRITAIDASQKMIEMARHKSERLADRGSIEFFQFDISDFGKLLSRGPVFNETQFDGVFSNFGVLNCVPERKTLAKKLAGLIKPGGKAVFVLMSPFCPWEIGWHVLHGQFRAAFRRLHKDQYAHIGYGKTVPVWYPNPKKLQDEFKPYFKIRDLQGIGTLLPPTYFSHFVERWSYVFRVLNRWDDLAGRFFPGTWLNDHYLVVFERVQ